MSRFVSLVGCLTLLIASSGCGGGSPFETVPVTGKVEIEGGGSLAGYAMKSIQFTPNSTATEVRAASGTIGEDGTFKLGTMKADDGALPGKYLVRATILKNYPPSPAELKKTWIVEPAEVEVTDGMEPIVIKVKEVK